MRVNEEILKAGGMDNLCRQLIERASVSRIKRRDEARRWRTLFHTGSTDGTQKRVNLTRNYIDKLASLLFSPSDVRFEISFDADEAPEWAGVADLASRHINREFKTRKCNIAFSQALELALIEGSCFIKLVWGKRGYNAHVVRQHVMGVGREDLNDFADQDFFIHTYFLTEWELNRLLADNPKRKDIMEKVIGQFTEGTDSVESTTDIAPGSYLHEIVVGGVAPIQMGTASGSQGTAGIFGPPLPMLAAETASRLIQVHDIWLVNDTANDGAGGWGTIRWCEPGCVIDGEKFVRNLGDIPHEQPFIKVSPNELPGYFWGISEMAFVAYIQEWYAARVGNVDDIFALRARPPRSFEGFSGLTAEKMRALLTRGGTFVSDMPAGSTRINTHAPDMPPEAMDVLRMIHASFDEAGGMTGMMSGEAQPGVRAGNQANALIRMGTPRLRDRASIVEGQCTDFGELCYELSRVKEGRIFQVPESNGQGRKFTLSQIPTDAMISVDAHTSSPAFSGDNMQLAFALVRAGAIDGEDLLNMTQPPHVDELILKYRARQAAQQKEMKELEAKHPEVFEKLMEKKAGGRR